MKWLAGFLILATSLHAEVFPLPEGAKLAFEEDWSSGVIDPTRWYALRKKWGNGNHGVVPENVSIVDGALVCEAHGDRYTGPVTGLWKKPERVGGVLVTKDHFASGRFEVRMKMGSPETPRPAGMIPAIWTYGFRVEKVDPALADDFVRAQPTYNPSLQKWAKGLAFYWSELDFPEFGKAGKYDTAMYNTFLNLEDLHDNQHFDTRGAADGEWHTYTTDWRTHLVPIEGVTDAQVVEYPADSGYYWVQDLAIPFADYLGNPLQRRAADDYAVHAGKSATHWIDGERIGENVRWVPSQSAQLNLGVWLPNWAGPADWEAATVAFDDIRVWQFDDAGDVHGIFTEDITANFDANGAEIAPK